MLHQLLKKTTTSSKNVLDLALHMAACFRRMTLLACLITVKAMRVVGEFTGYSIAIQTTSASKTDAILGGLIIGLYRKGNSFF